MLNGSTSPKEFVVNIVTGKGGGGHYATYHALRAVAEQQQLPWKFQVTDMDDIMESITQQGEAFNLYKLLGSSVSDLYNQMLKRGWTWLWPLQMKLNKLLVKLNYNTGVEFFTSYWKEQQPDLVISVVTMCNKVLWDALQRAKPGTPYVTLPIDFADYPPGFWFEPDTDSVVFCATQKALEQARTLGVKESCIVPTSGMVIHPRFYKPIHCDRRLEREKLGLDPDCLTGIVMFGGNGSETMIRIAKKLEAFGPKLQLIFLCGHDQKLAEALKKRTVNQKSHVQTFTTNVPFYMHLADFFIGKPGPGSLSEALKMKLPVITNCDTSTLIHEKYNAQWIAEKKAGIVLSSFRNIDSAIVEFLEDSKFEYYQKNVAKISNRAVFETASFIQGLLDGNYDSTLA